jgi:hypothetical protein
MKAKTASESDGCSCRKISRLVWMGCCVEESIFVAIGSVRENSIVL